jgi:hypothetical protein
VCLVLHLDPTLGGAGSVGQVDAFTDNAFEPELAGVVEDHRAVALKVLDVFDPAPRPPQELEELLLPLGEKANTLAVIVDGVDKCSVIASLSYRDTDILP